MRITDMIRFAAERGEPVFSFEFFPPKNDAGVHALFESLHSLRPLGPSFVSVTWGAGGSTRGRTLEMVTRIKKLAEDAKVALRNIRRDANKHFDQAEKAKEMTEDERDKGKEEVQSLLKKFEDKVAEMAEKKTQEVMEQ